MSYFWCAFHNESHLLEDMNEECLPFGPFSTIEEADEFGGIKEAGDE